MIRLRRISQTVFWFLAIVLFVRARYPYSGSPASDLFLRASPLVGVMDAITRLALSPAFWPAYGILFLTLIFGRFFCGWVCPLGTSFDLQTRILGRKPEEFPALRFPALKYGVLGFVAFLALFSVNAWGFFDPISLFHRVMTIVIYPLVTRILLACFSTGTGIPVIGEWVFGLQRWVKKWIVTEEISFHQGEWLVLAMLVFLAVMEILQTRFWCRNLCPAGALLGLVSRFKWWNRKVENTCVSCRKCEQTCKTSAIPSGRFAETQVAECILCYQCVSVCPVACTRFSLKKTTESDRFEVNLSRRGIVGTAVGAFIGAKFTGISLQNPEDRFRLIRPPGALPEKKFLQTCIRCLECVRMCQSNGKCLQPDQAFSRVMEILTPVALMRPGYCEYNCNLCGQVCPTQAIVPMKLTEKQKTVIGMAAFDKNLCIPFQRNEDCLVCEEHCPLPEKAIQFEVKEAILPDGSKRKVKYPYIDRSRCIGCGICEHKCPLPGAPGVFVVTVKEQYKSGN